MQLWTHLYPQCWQGMAGQYHTHFTYTFFSLVSTLIKLRETLRRASTWSAAVDTPVPSVLARDGWSVHTHFTYFFFSLVSTLIKLRETLRRASTWSAAVDTPVPSVLARDGWSVSHTLYLYLLFLGFHLNKAQKDIKVVQVPGVQLQTHLYPQCWQGMVGQYHTHVTYFCWERLQGLSQDSETGCPKLATVKSLGIHF